MIHVETKEGGLIEIIEIGKEKPIDIMLQTQGLVREVLLYVHEKTGIDIQTTKRLYSLMMTCAYEAFESLQRAGKHTAGTLEEKEDRTVRKVVGVK